MAEITKKTLDLKTPDLGDTDKIELLKWFVSVGDIVREGDELVELVTDKAAFPVEAPLPGKIIQILKLGGSIVQKDEILGVLEYDETTPYL
jgi:pyruvate/2-oxoglutarate dehydrogenase complex dihydrolipoamide acyltransferase (E2) component